MRMMTQGVHINQVLAKDLGIIFDSKNQQGENVTTL